MATGDLAQIVAMLGYADQVRLTRGRWLAGLSATLAAVRRLGAALATAKTGRTPPLVRP